MFTHLLLIITLCEVRSLTPIYKPGRLREPKLLAWGHITSKWWRWDKNLGILAAELMLPNTTMSVLCPQISPSACCFMQLIHLGIFYLTYTVSFVRALTISSKRISLLASWSSSVLPYHYCSTKNIYRWKGSVHRGRPLLNLKVKMKLKSSML